MTEDQPMTDAKKTADKPKGPSNKIELLKSHTHKGEKHPKGAVITVGDGEAKWMVEHGVGKKA